MVGVVVKLLVGLIFFESLPTLLAWMREASASKMSSLEIILSVSVCTMIKFSKQDAKSKNEPKKPSWPLLKAPTKVFLNESQKLPG